jgi:transketolase
MMTNSEQIKKWKANKKALGWKTLNFVVPPELAAQLQELKKQYKLKNIDQWQKF